MFGLPGFNQIIERVTGHTRFTREDAIVWGVLLVGLLVVLVVLWDVVIFVASVAAKREHVEVKAGIQPLRKEEIDEVINLLDERKKKFDALLE